MNIAARIFILVLLDYKMWLWSLSTHRKYYLFELQPWVSAHSLAQVVAESKTVKTLFPNTPDCKYNPVVHFMSPSECWELSLVINRSHSELLRNLSGFERVMC